MWAVALCSCFVPMVVSCGTPAVRGGSCPVLHTTPCSSRDGRFPVLCATVQVAGLPDCVGWGVESDRVCGWLIRPFIALLVTLQLC